MTIYSRLCRGGVLPLLGALLFIFPLAANAAMQHGKVQTAGQPIAGATVKLFHAGASYDDEAELLGSAKTNPGGEFEIEYDQPGDAEAVLYLIADGGSVNRGNRRRLDFNDKLAKLLEDTETPDLAVIKAILAGFLADKRSHRLRPNSTIKLATVLGRTEIPNNVIINERTTVATAYTMAQFLAKDTISGPIPGVPNAADIFRNLVNPGNGKIGQVLAASPNGNETDTLQAFNSLANMLAVCVSKKSRCKKLFKYTTPPSGEAEPAPPTDTLQAMLNIVHYPYQNPHKLYRYSMKKSQQRYKPTLDDAPDAWTLALRYNGNGKEMDGPGFIAFDEQGSAWIANNYNWTPGTADPDGVVCGAEDVLRLSPTGEDAEGAPYTGGGANGAGFGLLIDWVGDIWQGNFGFAGTNCATPDKVLELSHSVSKYDKDGNALSPDNMLEVPGGYPGDGNIFGPQGMSSDPNNGNIWISNCRNTNEQGNQVTMLPGGDVDPDKVKSFAPFDFTNLEDEDPGYLPKPFGMTVDPDGVAWVAGNNINQVVGIDEEGNRIAIFGNKEDDDLGRNINRPMGLASDSQGGIWVANSGIVDIACGYQLSPEGDSIEGEDSTFTSLQDAGILDDEGHAIDVYDGELASIALIKKSDSTGKYELTKFARGGGVIVPWGIALDGNDNVWVANFDGQRLSHLCGSRTETCPSGKQEVGKAISPDLTGYSFAGLVRNTGVSIDPSGNVWLTNNWLQDPIQTNPGGREVVVFLGLAKPVKTPMVGYPEAP